MADWYENTTNKTLHFRNNRCIITEIQSLVNQPQDKTGSELHNRAYNHNRPSNLATFPPQLISRSRGEKALFLHGCEIKAGVGRTGNEATVTYTQVRRQYQEYIDPKAAAQ